MSNIGAQKTSSKQNQQFNELLSNNIKTKEIIGVSNCDLLINSYYKNQSNQQNTNNNINNINNINNNDSKIIINKGIIVNTKGDLLVSRNLQLLDINSCENPINLYNDENNLIWGTDVVITDATLQSEIENLKLQDFFFYRVCDLNYVDTTFRKKLLSNKREALGNSNRPHPI